MIKTILAWITGKSDNKAPEVPYKVEALPAGTEAANITAVYVAPEAAATTPIPLVVELPVDAVEVSPVTVKAKYKRADLNKMTKAELMELVTKHSVKLKHVAQKKK